MSAGTAYKKENAYTLNNKAELLLGGKNLFDRLISMIQAAKESIHIQVYIFQQDETGNRVAEALKSAARKNVAVYVLVDGYASRKLSRNFIRDLREAGIHFRFFEPIFRTRRFYFGRRLHHKVFVTDAKQAMVGGVNISNHYNDIRGKKAWLDFALYLEGPAARELCNLCWKGWNNFVLFPGSSPCKKVETLYAEDPSEGCRVAIQQNDWVRRKNQVSSAYSHMLLHAQKDIILLSSYFLPGRFMRHLLAKAADRGITIRIITAGKSDIPFAKQAERYMYTWLLRKNIQVYEYRPGILHGKIAVSDTERVTVGSYNINNLSAYASIELNIEVLNNAFAEMTRSVLEDILKKDCTPITAENHSKSPRWFLKIKRWAMFQLIRAGLFLSTFYYRHTVTKKKAAEQSPI